MKLKVKKIHEAATLPRYATDAPLVSTYTP